MPTLDRANMDLTTRLDELGLELKAFRCRPQTLVPDIVLLALASDLLETGIAVRDTVRSALPHKAYSNARLAFETAQNLLVLATHEHYESAGALAWAYFEAKDASWRAEVERNRFPRRVGPTEEQYLQSRVDEMARIWSSVSNNQGALLCEALAVVCRDRKKNPDNWLHENMAHRQHRAYALFAASCGKGFSAESAELNKKIYQALCRETHVSPRLDSFGVIHDGARDTVHIDILPRNLEQARNAVAAGTELSVWEGALALRWQRSGAL